MQKISKHLILTLLAVLSIGLASCNKDEDNNHFSVPGDAIWQIATMEQTGPSGTVFTYCKDNTSTPITITCTNNLSDLGLKDKVRLIIAFKPLEGPFITSEGFTGGPVTLYGVALLSGTMTFTGTAEKYGAWASDPIRMLSLVRAGEYINATVAAEYKKQPTFILVFDQTTVDDEIPEAYIIFKTDSSIDQNYHETVYGSFSIADVWSKDTCKGIRVYYKTATGRQNQIFNKPTPLSPEIPGNPETL